MHCTQGLFGAVAITLTTSLLPFLVLPPRGLVSDVSSSPLTTYSATATAAAAAAVPDIQGLFGAIAITPTTFLLPPLLWLLYKQPRKWGKEWLVNWFLVIITGIMGILGTIGALYGIISASSTYRIFAS
jgi:hypothetical protein